MRTYGKNILPTEGSAYILHGAKISGEHLLFSNSGGTAVYHVKEDDIKRLTEYMMFNCLLAPSSDEYIPDITMTIDLQTVKDKFFNYVCNLAADEHGAVKTELELVAEEYSTFEITFRSNGPAVLTLWELHPEANTNDDAVIDGVRQSLPRLVYDFNTIQQTIGQHEKQIALITCKLQHDTDLQGHLLINVNASTRCDTYLRIYDGVAEELYCPIKTTMNPGHNVIEVPHAYLHRQSGPHNFYVTLQATAGQLVAETRGILYTIDGGYLAERLSNPGMDIRDVAFKWPEGEDAPSEIWAAGVDNKHIIVKKMPYSKDKNNTAWEAVYDLGEGLDVAIEFDGKWTRPIGEKHSNIITDELPTIALITNENKLQLYQNGTNEKPILMSENAKSPSLLRGYSSEEYPDKNQGLILSWIRDKKVFYKQYTYIVDSISWTQEAQLTETDEASEALFVQVHRLNDYRVGFLVQYADKNKWYISDRTYVAQAVPKEAISTGFHGHLQLNAPAIIYKINKCCENTTTATKGICDLFMFTAEEIALFTFTMVQNDLSSVTTPQADFTVTFENMYKVLPFNIEAFIRSIVVTLYDTVLSADKYTISLNNATLTIHLHEPSTGKIGVTWPAMRFNFYLDAQRYLKSKPMQGSFVWTIYKYVYSNNYEMVDASMDGAATMHVMPIAYLHEVVPENITAGVAGTAILSTTQTGDIPI